VAAHRLGQDEAYFTVREILAEASTAADGVLWREPSDFSRCGYATLGCSLYPWSRLAGPQALPPLAHKWQLFS